MVDRWFIKPRRIVHGNRTQHHGDQRLGGSSSADTPDLLKIEDRGCPCPWLFQTAKKNQYEQQTLAPTESPKIDFFCRQDQ